MTEKYFNINASGHSIRCKSYCNHPKDIRRAVLCGHGFGGHKDNKAAQRFADYVLKKHKDIVIVTYNAPCHGDDVNKKLRMEDCMTYIEIVTQYIRKQYATDDICVYATSFGGYQFLKYLSENGNPYRKIALRCPAVNMYEVLAQRIMQPEEIKALSRNKSIAVGFDRKIQVTQTFLDELRASDISALDYSRFADDILILHGTKDEVVSCDLVKAFSEKNNIPFISVENADHRFKDPLKMDTAIKAIVEFLGI